MGNCYSIDHIAEEHIQTDIACSIEEPQQKYHLGTVSNRLLVGGLKLVLLDPNLTLCASLSKELTPAGYDVGMTSYYVITSHRHQLTSLRPHVPAGTYLSNKSLQYVISIFFSYYYSLNYCSSRGIALSVTK